MDRWLTSGIVLVATSMFMTMPPRRLPAAITPKLLASIRGGIVSMARDVRFVSQTAWPSG